MPSTTDTIVLIVAWTWPFVVLGLIAGLLGLYLAYDWLQRNRNILKPEFYWFVVAGVATPLLLLGFGCMVCWRVFPTEGFEDASTLLTDLQATEDAVCKLITRVDGFIQNDVGPAGQNDTGLIDAAQAKARAGVTMVDCLPPVGSPDKEEMDVKQRLTRLEDTLRAFTGPELQRTYDTTMKCEGFQDASGSALPSPRDRLTAIQATLRDQQNRLLAPVDQKSADLQRGVLSDCDKRRGAAAAQKLPGGSQ